MKFILRSPRVAYKKVVVEIQVPIPGSKDSYPAKASALATLIIPAGARVRLPFWYWGKNRADLALVARIEVLNYAEGTTVPVAHARRDPWFDYKVGEYITPEGKYDTSLAECSDGIHFFRSIEKARAW